MPSKILRIKFRQRGSMQYVELSIQKCFVIEWSRTTFKTLVHFSGNQDKAAKFLLEKESFVKKMA